MGLIACKECGAEISDSANSCPKCGAKRPASLGIKISIGVCVLVVLVVGIAFLSPDSEEQKAFNSSLENLRNANNAAKK